MIKNFFLVDDDKDDTDLFAETLKSIDPALKFDFAHNGWDLISKLKTGAIADPHIIFLDINMPEINGWQCLEELKKINKLDSIPVIMYSTSSVDAEKAVNAGALCHYKKPSSLLLLKEFLELISATSRIHLKRIIKEIQRTGRHVIFTE